MSESAHCLPSNPRFSHYLMAKSFSISDVCGRASLGHLTNPTTYVALFTQLPSCLNNQYLSILFSPTLRTSSSTCFTPPYAVANCVRSYAIRFSSVCQFFHQGFACPLIIDGSSFEFGELLFVILGLRRGRSESKVIVNKQKTRKNSLGLMSWVQLSLLSKSYRPSWPFTQTSWQLR
jgi:hypothetical protein